MKLTVITLTMNEQILLPFFLRHYERIADRILIYDGGSTDRTRQIAEEHHFAELRDHITGGKIDDGANARLKSTAYADDDADWFIVVDVDELIYHPDLRGYLADCDLRGVSLVKCEGWNMIGDTIPTSGYLTNAIRYGVRDELARQYYDKPCVFKASTGIWFAPGAHDAMVLEGTNVDTSGEVKLLHYKWLSRDFVAGKANSVQLSQANIENKWGYTATGETNMTTWLPYYDAARAARVRVI